MSEEPPEKVAAPIVYVTDLGFDAFDPADLFDLAFLARSTDHDLRAVCLADEGGSGRRVLDALAARAPGAGAPVVGGADGLLAAMRDADGPVNLIVTGGFGVVSAALDADKAGFREKVARLFLVGGHVNDYGDFGRGAVGERLPIDPRLRERNPERFAPSGDSRLCAGTAFARLLSSGEAVIWLPRDVCLWRYAAPGILEDGGPLCEFLLRELFWSHLRANGADGDRYDAADAPVLLSALPALMLAVQPDPFSWMRLFRAVAARVEVGEGGRVASFTTRTDTPNLYAVVAIDGQALGKLLTARLRDRPLVAG